MASIFQIDNSRNTNGALTDSFRKSNHNFVYRRALYNITLYSINNADFTMHVAIYSARVHLDFLTPSSHDQALLPSISPTADLVNCHLLP